MSTLAINYFQDILGAFKAPALITDSLGKVALFNGGAREIIRDLREGVSIEEIFDLESLKKVESSIERSRVSKKKEEDIVDLLLPDGSLTKYEVGALFLLGESGEYFIITFESSGVFNKPGRANKFRILLSEQEVERYGGTIKQLIGKVENSFPFTILGREEFQKEIDSTSLLFWMLDPDNLFIIANENLTKTLGVSTNQIEGKAFTGFIPEYQSEFYNGILRLIKSTLNSIEIDGNPFGGLSQEERTKTLIVPLIDFDNQVRAFLFFGVSAEQKEKGENIGETISLKKFPLPVVLADEDGNIHDLSDEFKMVFGFGGIKGDEKRLSDYLDRTTVDGFFRFVSGTLTDQDIYIRKGEGYKEEIEIFRMRILKFGDKIKNKDSFLLTFQNESVEDDFSKLFKIRGKMFDVIVKKNPEPIFIYTLDDLRFVEVNEAAEKLYGYTREEFLKMDLTDLYSPEDIQSLLVDTPNKLKENEFQGPFKHKKRDGSLVHVEIFKDTFLYEGRRAHFIIVRNVEKKYESEKDLSVFRAVFENSREAVFLTDSTGFIKYVNESAIGFLRRKNKKEIEGSSIISYLVDSDRGKLNSLILNKSLGKNNLEVAFNLGNGERTEVNVLLYPVGDESKEPDFYAIMISQTKNEKTEKEAIRELSNGNGVVGLSKETLSGIFHEILTPINVIIGFVQELKEGFDSPDNDQIEAMNLIAQNRVNLLDTMNSISEYSGLLSGQFQVIPKDFRVFDLMESLEKDLADDSILRQKQLLLKKVSKTIEIKSDKKILKEFIFGLLKIMSRVSNSESFYISYYQYDEQSIMMSFRDGEEISGKLMKLLKSVLIDGSSIIVNTYGMSKYSALTIQKMGEMLNLEYEPIKKSGKEVEFGIIMPLELEIQDVETIEEIPLKSKKKFKKLIEFDSEEENASGGKFPSLEKESEEESEEFVPIIKSHEKEDKPKFDLSRLNCLYLEDQIDSQILFKVQMKELKEIEFAVGFEEAEQFLIPGKFDFIVMDINLHGEYNGLDALKMIRMMRGFATIPIIAVSAYILPGDKDNFIKAGFTDFIAKPLFREKVIEVLERIFSQK
ncbi:MAG: PAS domain S-box protein, partial [Ignavibacteriaceae bacterium]|jgi:PAS domain S-box-containing protein|nr:PAS domain S-box protein [Ignavibacteriaceae bacterium]